MSRLLVAQLLVLATSLLTRPGDGTQTGFLDRSAVVDGKTYRYQLYLPLEYDSSPRWPVLVDLHGNGAQGSDGIRQTAHFLPEEIRLHRSRFPFIVVFPQAASGGTWTTGSMPAVVNAEIDATLRDLHADPDRVYLSGFSMGATGAYEIGARRPDRFAAIVAIAGPLPGDAATVARALQRIPIHIFHGGDDERVPVEDSRTLVAELKRVNAPVTYTEYPATHHGPAAEKTYGDPAVFDWLLAQRRHPRVPRD
jgi:predicted peptidase